MLQTSRPSLLRVNEVAHKRGHKEILSHITVEFPIGVTAILGPNGAGKTTLIGILAGITNPTAGATELLVDGKNLTGRQRARQVGWLPQSFGYPPRMRVLDFLKYSAWLKEVPRRNLNGAIERVVDATDISDVTERRMGELSGGTQRRVGLAAASIHSPEVLLLDEPTAGLDPVQRTNFHALVRNLAQDSVVVFATHLLEDVAAVADVVAIVSTGKIAWRGSPEELANRSDNDSGSYAGGLGALREGLFGVIEKSERD